MNCSCKLFKKWQVYINKFVFLGYTHGMKYTFENENPMKYCPFCGEKLKEVSK